MPTLALRTLAPLLWALVLAGALGCASQRFDDPHLPGDHCLYSCPDGLVCAGTTFQRSRAIPGHCALAPNRCLATEDCRPHEDCVRPGQVVGVCRPQGLI